LLDTVRLVHRGESVLTPQIARKVMDQFRRLSPRPDDSAPHDERAVPPVGPGAGAGVQSKLVDMLAEPLTEKEARILELIVDGNSNKQIAKAVFLAEGTVKNYVSRIMDKFHANTRTELAVMSLRQSRRAVP